MKITRNTLKKISICSLAVAVALLIFSIFLFGTSPDFDYLLIVVFTVGGTPATFASLFHNKWKNQIVRQMPEFLRDLGASIQTGIPIQAALESASKRDYGPLTDELKIMLSHMSWGLNFEDAMIELSERIDLPLVKKSIILILEASRHGGDYFNIFSSTAHYMENTNTWDLRRKAQTLPYVAIFYFSVVIFLFIIIMISRVIFIPITELNEVGTPLITPILTTIQARRIFLHAALLEAFFGGILAGKINESSFTAGLKHSMLLSIISGVSFFIFFR